MSMEGGSKQERGPGKVEILSDWQTLRDSAQTEVEKMLSGIQDLPKQEKIEATKEIISELTIEGDNKNRFLVKELARRVAIWEEEVRNRQRLVELGVV